MPLVLAPSGITNSNLAAGAGIVQFQTSTSGGYGTTSNGSTWATLGNIVTITPTKTGNRIIVSAQFVYPKETSNIGNINQYRLRYGSTYQYVCSESFQYSDPYLHENLTGLGFAQAVYTVAAGDVGSAQTCSIEWVAANGSYSVGAYVQYGPQTAVSNVAIRVQAVEVA